MKTKVTSVAARGGSTKFGITSDLGLRWQTSATDAKLEQEVSRKFDSLNKEKITTCLLADCPYELYWYEKTAMTQWDYSFLCSLYHTGIYPILLSCIFADHRHGNCYI